MKITLNENELNRLFDPAGTRGQGGFQSLLESLQARTERTTGALKLTDDDLERISRYAFDYGNGGWENRLKVIFERTLGANLSGHQP